MPGFLAIMDGALSGLALRQYLMLIAAAVLLKVAVEWKKIFAK